MNNDVLNTSIEFLKGKKRKREQIFHREIPDTNAWIRNLCTCTEPIAYEVLDEVLDEILKNPKLDDKIIEAINEIVSMLYNSSIPLSGQNMSTNNRPSPDLKSVNAAAQVSTEILDGVKDYLRNKEELLSDLKDARDQLAKLLGQYLLS